MTKQHPFSVQLFNRLTRYLNYLRNMPAGGPQHISATAIAEGLALNDVQVRKDLAGVSSRGRPRIGYITKELIADIEHFLGHDICSNSALVGVGNLGRALLSYENFAKYGLHIVATFDNNPQLVGTHICGQEIYPLDKAGLLCKRLNIQIGIIAVPAPAAQEVCNTLTAGGIRAIWNFAPVNLITPENVVVKNEDMAASLAILTNQLSLSLTKYGLE